MPDFRGKRLAFWINRFSDLRRAEQIFTETGSPVWCERRLFGHRFRLDIARTVTHKLLYLQGERYVEERALVASLLRSGMTAVDVGANIGYYLLLLERSVGPGGRVICIEPSEENLPELRDNIALNGFANVRLHEVAIGAESGTVGFRSGINGGVTEREAGIYEVPVRPLDSLLDDGERVDFLKIDVEGFEGQVLEGARRLLERDRPVLFLEMHPHILARFGFGTRRIVDLLEAYYHDLTFYEIRRRDGATGVWDKVVTRYFGADPLLQIADRMAYVDACEDGTVRHTFWIVARN